MELLNWMTVEYGELTGAPFLMPAFIRPPEPGLFHERRGRHDNLDTHSFRRDALLSDHPDLYRMDRQILAMIDDAMTRLSSEGVDPEDGVIFNGWSAAGSLGDQMATLHPNRVKALFVGGFGATPVLPIKELDGSTLTFPTGVGDIEDIFGKPFDLESYLRIPYVLAHGTADPNDPIPDVDPFGLGQRAIVKRVLGDTPMDRVERVRNVFASVGKTNFELRLYDGVDHDGSRDIAVDQLAFLRDHFR